MDDVECACGAVGRVVPSGTGPSGGGAAGEIMRWRGGRVGVGRVALERARDGESTCPACRHRHAVYVLTT